MTLFTYRYWHPVYREYVTLDCAAETRELAQVSAVKWIRRMNRRLRKAGVAARAQIPSHVSFLKEELPASS